MGFLTFDHRATIHRRRAPRAALCELCFVLCSHSDNYSQRKCATTLGSVSACTDLFSWMAGRGAGTVPLPSDHQNCFIKLDSRIARRQKGGTLPPAEAQIGSKRPQTGAASPGRWNFATRVGPNGRQKSKAPKGLQKDSDPKDPKDQEMSKIQPA